MAKAQPKTDTEPKAWAKLRAARAAGITAMAIFAVFILLGIVLPRAIFPSINTTTQARELEENRAKWESQHITHYRMSLDIWGFSEVADHYDRMPLIIEVKNSKVVSVVNAHGTKWPPDYPDLSNAFTMPGLFSIANDWILKKPASVDVTYHPTLGFPTDITIDPWDEPCCQWRGYRVEGFEELLP